MDVLGVGNAIVDVLVPVEESFLEAHGLTKGSMRLIEEGQARSLYSLLGSGVEMSGGSAANTMAGLSFLGGTAGFLGVVRQDQLGEVFAHDISASGVIFSSVPRMHGPATGRCLVLVTPDGERTMSTFLGASATLTPEDIIEDTIDACGVLYLEGYLFDPPEAKKAFFKALLRARYGEKTVALSLSDTFCVERHRADFLDLIEGGVDLLFGNEAELKALFEVSSTEEAVRAVAGKCRLCVLTRSAQGALLIRENETLSVSAVPVDEVVDTTGAGDLYAAGFLRAWTQGRDLATCGHEGAKAASRILTQLGARLAGGPK